MNLEFKIIFLSFKENKFYNFELNKIICES